MRASIFFLFAQAFFFRRVHFHPSGVDSLQFCVFAQNFAQVLDIVG